MEIIFLSTRIEKTNRKKYNEAVGQTGAGGQESRNEATVRPAAWGNDGRGARPIAASDVVTCSNL